MDKRRQTASASHCDNLKDLPNFKNTQMNKNMKQLQKMFISNNFEIMKLKNDQTKKQ